MTWQDSLLMNSKVDLLASHHRLDLKLDRIEAAKALSTAQSGSRTTGSSTIHPEGVLDRNYNGAFQISAAMLRWSCNSNCVCYCHNRRNFKTPQILESFFGLLFIGYAGIPCWTPRCDISACQHSKPTVLLTYYFPKWLLSRVLIVMGRSSPLHGPQLQLRVPRVISRSAKIFDFAMIGNIDGIKSLFKTGLGSPFDANELGTTALMVSHYHNQVALLG